MAKIQGTVRAQVLTRLQPCGDTRMWHTGSPVSHQAGESKRSWAMGDGRLPGRLQEQEQEPQEAPAVLCIAPKVGVASQAPQDNTDVDPGASSTDPGEQLKDTENPSAGGHHCWSGLLGHWGQGWSRLLGRQGCSGLLEFH